MKKEKFNFEWINMGLQQPQGCGNFVACIKLYQTFGDYVICFGERYYSCDKEEYLWRIGKNDFQDKDIVAWSVLPYDCFELYRLKNTPNCEVYMEDMPRILRGFDCEDDFDSEIPIDEIEIIHYDRPFMNCHKFSHIKIKTYSYDISDYVYLDLKYLKYYQKYLDVRFCNKNHTVIEFYKNGESIYSCDVKYTKRTKYCELIVAI